jgi:hypothetical protein
VPVDDDKGVDASNCSASQLETAVLQEGEWEIRIISDAIKSPGRQRQRPLQWCRGTDWPARLTFGVTHMLVQVFEELNERIDVGLRSLP